MFTPGDFPMLLKLLLHFHQTLKRNDAFFCATCIMFANYLIKLLKFLLIPLFKSETDTI